jgi:hypothetical protein
VEIAPDPRLAGNTRPTAAAFHPIIAPESWVVPSDAADR